MLIFLKTQIAELGRQSCEAGAVMSRIRLAEPFRYRFDKNLAHASNQFKFGTSEIKKYSKRG
jgi:hypothetical protein